MSVFEVAVRAPPGARARRAQVASALTAARPLCCGAAPDLSARSPRGQEHRVPGGPRRGRGWPARAQDQVRRAHLPCGQRLASRPDTASRAAAADDASGGVPAARRRRYSEFIALRADLRKAFPRVDLPPAPAKVSAARRAAFGDGVRRRLTPRPPCAEAVRALRREGDRRAPGVLPADVQRDRGAREHARLQPGTRAPRERRASAAPPRPRRCAALRCA
eukprot:scaffold4781_cov339-Prasinococcus_capsulatus_cf.AAC.20